MISHLILGVLFLIWGIADLFRIQLPGVLGKRTEVFGSEEARVLWQRLFGVLELVIGGGETVFYFFSDNGTVTRVILAVMLLAAVCILGPYYHWRREKGEDSDGQE